MCGVAWCWTGAGEDAEDAFGPVRAFGPPALDGIAELPFPALNGAFDGLYPPGLQWYWKADFVDELPDAAVAAHVEHGARLPSMHSTMHLYPIDRTVQRVGRQDTAWADRGSRYAQVIVGVDPDPAAAPQLRDWARAYHDALHPHSAGGAYVNMMMHDEGPERIRASYRDNYDRLVEIKRRYDPGNQFRINQNIDPNGRRPASSVATRVSRPDEPGALTFDGRVSRDAPPFPRARSSGYGRGVSIGTASETRLDGAAVRELEASFQGRLVRPEDPDYDEHRKVWNGSISRFPALIARCTGVRDVVAALRFARESDLAIAVRGGGHSFPGLSTCDAGIVVDLGPMKGIRVDPAARTARAQAGVLWGELDRETQAAGLATTGGIVTHTGIAGLTLGGGIGWLQRKHGLTVDQLLAVDLVTADGDLVRASATEHPDLFWAVRGGGGNFGVVTEFEFRLHPVGPIVFAGPVFWAIEDAPDVLRFYRDWIADAPDELMTIVVHRKAPPLPAVPRELHGQPVVAVVGCHAGSVDAGEAAMAPLKAFGSPVLDLCEPKPYVAHQAMFDPSFPHGWWYYMRACDVVELSDDVIDITVEHARQIRSPLTTFPIWQMGGAVARTGEDATAFGGRGAGHTFNITGVTESREGFEEEQEWVRGFWSALEPHRTGVYVNFLMEEGAERTREAYGAERYDRLAAIKRRYDPDNRFRLNQNILPSP
jgi:FAD/FMN-containing dehydrogenase